MGEVISISRVSDVDIFSQFDAHCPSIPEEIDSRIPRSARKAVDNNIRSDRPHHFRNHCVILVVLSVVVLAAVKLASSAIARQTTTGQAEIAQSNTDFRHHKDTWQAQIKSMENHPAYLRVIEEKRLFAQQYID